MFHDMSKRVRATGAALALSLGAVPAAFAAWDLNMPKGVTVLSDEIYDLHMLILWICVVIAILVFGAMIYSIVAFRRSAGAQPASFHHSTKAEIIWTTIPFLILIAMAIPSAKSLVRIEDASNPDMTVKVTGYQWKWHYDYLDDDFGFYSNLDARSNEASQLDSGHDVMGVDNYLRDVDNPMVVPVGKKVRILLTSSDVIHAWWVPELYAKKDAIPGFINEMWFTVTEPGVYRGQCAELCGRGHAYMPIVVVAMEQGEYDSWAAEQKGGAVAEAVVAETATEVDWDQSELMSRGESTYNTHCAACHQVNGAGIDGVFPALAGGPVTTGNLATHIDTVLNGREGTAMLAFSGQLSDLDIAAIITYERNAWGNDTGDVVQPADIQAAR